MASPRRDWLCPRAALPKDRPAPPYTPAQQGLPPKQLSNASFRVYRIIGIGLRGGQAPVPIVLCEPRCSPESQQMGILG